LVQQSTENAGPKKLMQGGNLKLQTAQDAKMKGPHKKTLWRTRMWADAQRDGRPPEYRWRRLLNAAKFGWRLLLECCAVTLRCLYTRTQDLDAKWILHLAKFHYGARAPENVYIVHQPGDGQTSCKVWFASVERRRCSNEAKTRNPL